MNIDNNTYVIIMAGGIGSLFWPISRNNMPKQFLDVLGVQETLIQLTYRRFLHICKPENIFIVTNIQYKKNIAEQLPNISPEQVLYEPARKNTAPCITYACKKISILNPNANIIIAASDHLIVNELDYIQHLQKSLDYVYKHNHLLTLGIQPTRPDTGYGYIQYVDDGNDLKIYKVKTFTEKPDKKLAEAFIASGEFLWNSGMFIWNVKTIMAAIQKHIPDIFEAFIGFEKVNNTSKEKAFLEKAYSLCPNISIDFGVMEKASNVRVLPSKFGWSDIGTWVSLYEIKEKDYLGNAVNGNKIMVYEAHNNIIQTIDDKLTIVQGLDNYIVVDTPDVLVICEKSEEQKIKDITADVKRSMGDKYL